MNPLARPTLLLACALLAAGCASHPQQKFNTRAHFEADFKAADTNHDEQLSREEVVAGMPALIDHFDEIDLDKNGQLNFAEVWNYIQWRNVANAPPPPDRHR